MRGGERDRGRRAYHDGCFLPSNVLGCTCPVMPKAASLSSDLRLRFAEGDMATDLAKDFAAATRKAFRESQHLHAIADGIQAELVRLRGTGWVVAIGRDVWRALRVKKRSHGVLMCSRPGKPDISVLACKCADDDAAPDAKFDTTVAAAKQHALTQFGM